ncbi:hypothetical protein EV424DRAFT_1308361 [Suillus variegatus]|nr:hypothetical protein EV424DRAFT_1308361 [Suillus variegatus]
MDELIAIGSYRDPSSSLPTIPLDILFDIFQHLPIQSVLALRQTSKSFYAITRLRSLWALLLRTLVQEQNIPIPYFDGKSLESLSALELERLTCRALALRSNWTNPNPNVKREIDFEEPSEKDLYIFFMEFLPGKRNRWFISVATRVVGQFRLQRVIQCWDLAVLQPVCIAKLTYMEGSYDRVVINDDPSSPAMIAIQSSLTEILTIDFEEKNPESAFVPLSTIDGLREIHLLSGSTLVTRRPEHDGEVSIWDISDQPYEKIQLVSPSLSPVSLLFPCNPARPMHLCDDYIVIIRCQIVELYSTIPRPNNVATPGVSISYPLAQHSFQRPLQSVYVSGQVNWHAARSRRPSPINIAVRYRSTDLWPANALHLFVLTPNPAYIPGRETSLYNLPYAGAAHSSADDRLTSTSDIALGRYGTVIWLDNYYEDWAYAREPSEFDQRLAGQILTATGGFSTSQHGSHDSMIFRVRDRNDWSVVAIDEGSGRIVVGDVDGTITLFEYL